VEFGGDLVEKQGMLQKNFQRGAESDGRIQNATSSESANQQIKL